MALPIFQTSNKDLMLMQTKWAGELNPVLRNPLTNASQLTGIVLITGVNVINHLLGQQMQGWYITDINTGASIYRSAPFNNLTLTLTSSAPATVNLVVF